EEAAEADDDEEEDDDGELDAVDRAVCENVRAHRMSFRNRAFWLFARALIGSPPDRSLRSGRSSNRSAPSSRTVPSGSSRERSSVLLPTPLCARSGYRTDPLLRRGLCLLALRASAHRGCFLAFWMTT